MTGRYPQHAALALIKDQSQSIYDFLQWLRDHHDIRLSWRDDTPVSDLTLKDLLAAFFEIDLKLLDDEKRQMLASIHLTTTTQEEEIA